LHFIFFLPFLPGGSIFYSALNSSFFSVGWTPFFYLIDTPIKRLVQYSNIPCIF
jgi:hypothetical protein